MKIVISYPPLDTAKGCATLGQNRQFQYFREATHIYPVVPAQAATMLKERGHEVIWNDCLAQGLDREAFFALIQEERPDLIAFETKTPVVKQHWRIINELKRLSTNHWPLVTILFGDHVTALPEESFRNSEVDFVLTGGDYDFLLVSLCNYLDTHDSRAKRVPSVVEGRLTTHDKSLEPGIYFRHNDKVENTGPFQLNHDLDSIPFIDRSLTRWELYAYKNGNYKRTPGTYMMSARDCWWGKCSFCSWPTLYPRFRTRSPDNVLDEAESLAASYNVREIMDDSGCFPVGEWLAAFCEGAVKRGLNRRVYLDCNMRFGALTGLDFKAMKRANFRLLLFGLESASQDTLERVNKNLKVERIIEDCRAAREAGLFPHITIMFGYPWESYDDAQKTVALGRWLLKKGYAYTMQATMVIPYPGSPLFKECEEDGFLRTLDWDDYDMKQPVIRTSISDEKLMELVQGMYRVSFSPEFIMRKLLAVRDFDDVAYYLRAVKKVVGHLFDFSSGYKSSVESRASRVARRE